MYLGNKTVLFQSINHILSDIWVPARATHRHRHLGEWKNGRCCWVNEHCQTAPWTLWRYLRAKDNWLIMKKPQRKGENSWPSWWGKRSTILQQHQIWSGPGHQEMSVNWHKVFATQAASRQQWEDQGSTEQQMTILKVFHPGQWTLAMKSSQRELGFTVNNCLNPALKKQNILSSVLWHFDETTTGWKREDRKVHLRVQLLYIYGWEFPKLCHWLGLEKRIMPARLYAVHFP